MEQAELQVLYAQTFNSPWRSRMVFDKMIKKYDDFFAKEKQDAEKRLNQIVAGKTIHESMKTLVHYYESAETAQAKRNIARLDEEMKKEYLESKRKMNEFLDGII